MRANADRLYIYFLHIDAHHSGRLIMKRRDSALERAAMQLSMAMPRFKMLTANNSCWVYVANRSKLVTFKRACARHAKRKGKR